MSSSIRIKGTLIQNFKSTNGSTIVNILLTIEGDIPIYFKGKVSKNTICDVKINLNMFYIKAKGLKFFTFIDICEVSSPL